MANTSKKCSQIQTGSARTVSSSYEEEIDQSNPDQSELSEDDYPEGGWASWSVVLGSWMACFGTMGLMNSVGIFQAYLENHELRQDSTGKVGWIFGLYNFLAFFCGIQIGPIFDAKGPRSLAFNPAISIIAHYFNKRRGLATGIASSGASFGGVVFPLLFQHVVVRVGFAWTTRIIALVVLVAFSIAILLIRARRPSKTASIGDILPDLTIFCDRALMLASMSIFFMEWGLFVPLTYLISYALSHGQSSQFSFLLLSLINAGSIFGRWIPGYCADRIGRFNTLIITLFGCLLCTVCLWLPAGSSKAIIAIFALLFGFFSGSNVSLAPVCIGQLCKLEAFGRYYATAYAIVSIRYLIDLISFEPSRPGADLSKIIVKLTHPV
ncbi:hypothetical protein N7495_001388 [Penicillium taxi]|uniref:uncharacterized protein n=1 Tax=Penicillium taxi TaxID=168475 RepID=UPI0025456C5E|nr:uncharacterized protein N7495_001388 [Penicillium taxi]KAJ5908706.1 hypothetical protein N7495_001388 [Penicillium taxi]